MRTAHGRKSDESQHLRPPVRAPQLAPRPRRTGVVVLAWMLWILNVASLAWLTFLVALTVLWGAAEGAAAGGFVLQFVLIVTGAVVAVIALAFAPGVRRLHWAGRLLLTGTLTCPVTTGLAIGSWIYVG
ncbi:hypothetical protein OG978_41825 (plasmid) [Streptomyces sp. NBC_01591]|uniref:hypothetical protein n=1 Tax=Streptomyces sp. NBC_01591 TaxID=2975888 RepID=UPI002DDC1DBE|nr:hypothetical protein [Streptomyces sp. NBC_01591]WSD73752.1 hypothetical protein OG978_41825 [Streptomyces sp. NBC_01591]